jgi:hypothetical protein
MSPAYLDTERPLTFTGSEHTMSQTTTNATPPVQTNRSGAALHCLPAVRRPQDGMAPPIRRWETGGTAWSDVESVFFGSGYSDSFSVPWAPRQFEVEHPLLATLTPAGGFAQSWQRAADASTSSKVAFMTAAVALMTALAGQAGSLGQLLG